MGSDTELDVLGVLVVGDEPSGLARARRWVEERLDTAGLGELAETAKLVLSELLSNALMHAGPPAEVQLAATGASARLAVGDTSPAAPVRSPHLSESMTGRGLHLVEGLAHDWGVERRSQGKVVWAELNVDAAQSAGPDQAGADELLERWAADELDLATTGSDSEPRYAVRLADVPTGLLLEAKAHVEDLAREFALAASGARSGATADVPVHLADLVQTMVYRFAEPRQMIKRQAQQAASAGSDRVTLELELPLSTADAAQAYLDALDQAEAYCRAARLLTLEPPPRHQVFRRWYVDELIGQLNQAAAGDTPSQQQTFEQRLLAEIDTVAIAERTAERSARLHSVSAALARAVTPQQVANYALHEGVAALGAAGGGLVLAADDATLHVPGTVGYDEAMVEQLRAEPPDADLPAAVAARTREAVWLESQQDRDQRFPELIGFEPGTVSMCAVPLLVGDRCLGALRFSFSRARLFDDDERAFMWTVAAEAAQALERAQLYEQHTQTARRLQRSLLPPDLPAIDGVEVASHYDTAEAADIGGDFYDVIGVEDGWTLVIGDVRGKGIDAASLTAMARHTVRAGALSGRSPDRILGLLNEAFLAQDEPESFATAVCGHLTVHRDHATLTLAAGGHPPPLLRHADGSVEPVALHGLLVGMFADPDFATTTVTLQPNDFALLYTDGLTEARNHGELFGVDRVATILSAAAHEPAQTVLERLHAEVEAFQGTQHDDMAMLALRLASTRP